MRLIKSFKNAKVLLLAGLFISGLSLTAFSQGLDVAGQGISIGPRASYFKPKDADKGEWSGGAQIRLKPSRAIGFEGSIDYRREDFGATEVHVYPVQASLLAYILPLEQFNVFALGGGGWYYTRVDRPSPNDDTTDHRFGLHAGGGLEFNLNDVWSLDGTYRYLWLEKFTSKGADLIEKDFSDNGSQVTIGLNYHFQ